MDGLAGDTADERAFRRDIVDSLDAKIASPTGARGSELRPGKPQRPAWLDEELRRDAEYEKLKSLCAELATMKQNDEAEIASLREKAEGEEHLSPEAFEESYDATRTRLAELLVAMSRRPPNS